MLSCLRSTARIVSGVGTSRCLAILYLPMTLPTAVPILAAPRSRPARTRAAIGERSLSVAASKVLPFRGRPAGTDAGGDRGKELRGGGQQGLALTGGLGGQHRIAAGDQPLAGEVRR